jgi:hypothetical protein
MNLTKKRFACREFRKITRNKKSEREGFFIWPYMRRKNALFSANSAENVHLSMSRLAEIQLKGKKLVYFRLLFGIHSAKIVTPLNL